MNYENTIKILKKYDGLQITRDELLKLKINLTMIEKLVDNGDLVCISKDVFQIKIYDREVDSIQINDKLITSYIKFGKYDELYDILSQNDYHKINKFAHDVLRLLHLKKFAIDKTLPRNSSKIKYNASEQDVYKRFYEAFKNKDVMEMKIVISNMKKMGKKFDYINYYEKLIDEIVKIKTIKDAVFPLINHIYDIIRNKDKLSNDELDELEKLIEKKDEIDYAIGNTYVFDLIEIIRLSNKYSIDEDYFETCSIEFENDTDALVYYLNNGYYMQALNLLNEKSVDIKPDYIYRGEINFIKILLTILKNNLAKINHNSNSVLKKYLRLEEYDEAFDYFLKSQLSNNYAPELALLKTIKR